MTRTRLIFALAAAIALTACGSDPDSDIMAPKSIPDTPEEPSVFTVDNGAVANHGVVLTAAAKKARGK